jgi:hypothetical protein
MVLVGCQARVSAVACTSPSYRTPLTIDVCMRPTSQCRRLTTHTRCAYSRRMRATDISMPSSYRAYAGSHVLHLILDVPLIVVCVRTASRCRRLTERMRRLRLTTHTRCEHNINKVRKQHTIQRFYHGKSIQVSVITSLYMQLNITVFLCNLRPISIFLTSRLCSRG